MVPRAAAETLSSEDYLKKLSGPKVDIYVSQKRKHFSISKDLLAYYSGYFENCFNPLIKQEVVVGKNTIYLLDEDADDFALIVDYIYRGTVLKALPGMNDTEKVARCFRFIELAVKLDISEAVSVVYVILKCILTSSTNNPDPMKHITPEMISRVWKILPPGNVLLSLLCQAAFPQTLNRGGGKYAQIIREHDGFAAETWRQFQATRGELSMKVPLSRSKKETRFF